MDTRLFVALILALLFLGAACGDDTSNPGVDASSGDATTPDSGLVDAGSTDSGDSGVVEVDPTRVAWETAEIPAEGPLRIWAPLTAQIDASTAFLFGGASAGTTESRAYIYRTGATAPTATEIVSDGPEARYCGCAGYDSARNVIVVAGGRNLSAPLSITPDTWELDLDTEVWTEISVPETPGGIGCHLGFAEGRSSMYLFGGAHEAGPSDKIFRYDPATPAWVEVAADTTRPSARYDGYFERLEGDELVLFGGSFGARGAAFFSDIWKFDASTETFEEVTAVGTEPPGRRVPWAVIREDHRGFYVAMGFDGEMMPMRDFWYFDFAASTWSELALPDELTARSFASWLPGAEGTLGTMLSGFDGTEPVGEVWTLR